MIANTEKLEQQIEALVREHLAICHRRIRTAVERAFVGATKELMAPPTQHKVKKKASGERRARRSPEELTELGNRFYAAVCDTPGETMAVLATRLEVSSRSLEKPVARLKKTGRVRSAGERQFTRYFPMVADTAKNEPKGKAALAVVGS